MVFWWVGKSNKAGKTRRGVWRSRNNSGESITGLKVGGEGGEEGGGKKIFEFWGEKKEWTQWRAEGVHYWLEEIAVQQKENSDKRLWSCEIVGKWRKKTTRRRRRRRMAGLFQVSHFSSHYSMLYFLILRHRRFCLNRQHRVPKDGFRIHPCAFIPRHHHHALRCSSNWKCCQNPETPSPPTLPSQWISSP